MGELLRDVDALHIVDRRLDGDANVGFCNAKSGIRHNVQRACETEVARVVGAKRHLYALVTINIGGVFYEITIERDGTARGDGAQELRLNKTDVVFVDIDFGEDVLEHGSKDVAGVNKFIHPGGALSFDNTLFLVLLFAIDLLRNSFIHRERKDKFTCFGRGFHVFLQEGHSFESAFFKDFWGDVAQGKGEFVVFLHAVVIVLAEIAGFLCCNYFFHQDNSRVVFARVFFAFGLYHCCS